MAPHFIAGMLAATLTVQEVSAASATVAPPAAISNSTASSAPAAVSQNWAAATPAVPSDFEIRMALREAMAVEEELAEAASKAAAIPNRYGRGQESGRAKYQRFEQQFAYAKIPGCFQRNGLKHQPTYIFSGLLAIPFLPIAALRGKCN